MNYADYTNEYLNIYSILAKNKDFQKALDYDVENRFFYMQYLPIETTDEITVRMYQTPSRNARSAAAHWDYFEIKVNGSELKAVEISKIMDLIINILHNCEVNNRYIELVSKMGNMYSPTEQYELGARFRFINFI